ncbi:uncharacterized protein LOC143037841 isoform X2 [Oratosquilla oratoria]|uniref:uncharacterized protein LOC143037841 isoform X2 n=1 Tax=Oratosquilla oratoria TaxID=337810 RepID=UPI003F7593E5
MEKDLLKCRSAGKLSRRAQRKLIETSGEEEKAGSFESSKGYWGNPQNAFPSWLKPISFQDSSLKKERHVFVKIPEVEEDCESDDDVVDIITAGDVDLHTTSSGPSGSGTDRAKLREGNRKGRSSLLTDIDEDGSFIEFCHVPKIQPVVQKHGAKGQLYYTCDSQNETNFSTSTKLQQAPVGLRKYIDAVEKIDYLGVISDERHNILPGSPVTNKGSVMYPTEDSILTGDSQFQSPGKPVLQQVINSTFAEFSNRKNQPVCRMSLQDVSSITTGCEIVLSSSSSSSSPVASPTRIKKFSAPKATDTVIVLDSSDDEKERRSTEDFEPKDTVTVRRKRSNNRKIRNDTIYDESLSLVLQMENITVEEKSLKEAVQKTSGLLEKSSHYVRDTRALFPIEETTSVPLSDPETTFHMSVSQQVLRNLNSYLPGKDTTPKENPLQEFLKATKLKNTTVSPGSSNGEVSPVAQWIMTSPFKNIRSRSKESVPQYDDRDTLLLSQDSRITNDHEQEGIREKELDLRDTLLLSQNCCLTNDHDQEEIRGKESENNKTVVTIGRVAKNDTHGLPETRKSPQLNLCKGLPSQSSEKNVLRSDSEPLPINKGTKIAGTLLENEENSDLHDPDSLMGKNRKGDGQSTSAETTFFNPNVDGQEYISLYQASTVNLTQLQKELDNINDSEWKTYKRSVLESTKVSATGEVQTKYVSSSSEEEGGLVESSKDLTDSQALRLHLTGKTESHPLITDDESDEVEEEECLIKRSVSRKLKRNTIESSGDETRCDEIEESLYIKGTLLSGTRKIVVESSDDEIEHHETDEENLYPSRTKSDKNTVTIRRKKSSNQRIRKNTLSDESLPLELQIEDITIQEKSSRKSVQQYPDILERNSHNVREHASVLIEEATTVLLSDPETTSHLSVSQQVFRNPTSCSPGRETTRKEKSPLEFLKATGRKNSVSQASTLNGMQLQGELDEIYGTEWRKNKSSVLGRAKVSATGKVQRKYVSSSGEEEGGFAESSKDLCNSQNLRLHFTDKTESHPLMTDDESDEVEEEKGFIKRSKHVKLKRNVLVSSDGGTSCDEVEDSFCIKTTQLNKPRKFVVESSDDESECCEVEESNLHIKRTESDKLRRIVVESSDDDDTCRKIGEESPHFKVTKSQNPEKAVVGSFDDETRCSELEEEHHSIKKTKAVKSRKIVIESSDDETKYSEAAEDSPFATKTNPEKTRNYVSKSPDNGIETSLWSEIRTHLSRPERKVKNVFVSESGSDSEEDVFKENKTTKNNDTNTYLTDSDDSSFYLPPLSKRLNVRQPRLRSTELGSISAELNIQKPKAATPLPGSFTERQPPREVILLTSDSDDEYSLPKPTKPQTQIIVKQKTPATTETNHTPATKPIKPLAVTEPRLHPKVKNKFTSVYTNRSSQHTPTLTFLSSLSEYVEPHRCHPEARPYLKNFKKCKEDLVRKLYSYYNNHVFENQLPADMRIEWNARMRKTAGFCYYQIDRSKPSGRGARLELSCKVIDIPERLRDTLIHEMCHAAAWIISGYKDGHGPLWKAWSARAMRTFPELPLISRCHSYEIACKYTYKCTQCGYSIGRHSKSLDTERKVCGHCRGRFELIVNSKPTPVSTHKKIPNSTNLPPPQPTPKTPRTPNAFALFVKANYGSMRKVKSSHGEVMKALSAEFSKLKTNHT